MAMDGLGRSGTDLPTGFADGDAIAVWARPYVASALRDGAVEGSREEAGLCFCPDRPIRRGEAAVILDRLLHLTEAEETQSAWADRSVANLEAAGVPVPGGDPEDTMTRAEAAMLLDGALDIADGRK